MKYIFLKRMTFCINLLYVAIATAGYAKLLLPHL